MHYTELIFDLYGTLVDIHTVEDAAVWEKTCLYFGYYGAVFTPEELKNEFMRLLHERKAKAGQDYECFPDIPIETLMEELFIEKGVTENVKSLAVNAAQLFRICSTDYIKLYPGAVEALGMLKKKGCRLWLLSNAQRVFTEYELRSLGLGEQFDGIYISSDFGFRKPDLRFYYALIEKEGLDVDKCLMIGNDRRTDIEGARALGMASIYMHTNITPPGQAPAAPELLPGKAPPNCRHFEYEGSELITLADMITRL